MSGTVYEVSRQWHGPRIGSSWDYYLVDIGAHSPHGRQPTFGKGSAKITKPTKLPGYQLESWYDSELKLSDDKYSVCGHIFFPTGINKVDDMSDKIVLDYIASAFVDILRTGKPVSLKFYGYADASGSSAFNKTLSEQRAKAVQEYFLRKLRSLSKGAFGLFRLDTQTEGRGEAEEYQVSVPNADKAGNSALNRRVDIVWQSTNVSPPGEIITGKYKGPPPKPSERPMIWVKVISMSGSTNEPFPNVPGVDRTSDVFTPSDMPGRSGGSADKAGLLAQAVQSAAEGLTKYVINKTIADRLEGIASDSSYTYQLKPNGPYDGVVVAVERYVNKADPSFPVNVGQRYVIGHGSKPLEIVDQYQKGQSEAGSITDGSRPYWIVNEYYWGTRNY
jgi:outer membrane protein OmpA-like peptidoglycan-associated protein